MQQVVAQAAVEAIVSCLILGMAVAGIAWILTRVLPPGTAGLRFAVWFSALGAIGLLPLLQHTVRSVTPAGAGLAPAKYGLILLAPQWAAWLLWPWVLLALLGLVRVAASAWHLHQVGSASTPIDPAQLAPAVRETVLRAAQVRAFDVRLSQAIQVPVAIGFLRPAVVLPQRLLQQLSADQLNQVLLHETTHLLRYDDWTNLLQKIARALLFFHPAVWWLENRLTLEREMACDEAVVAQTCNPRAYAECLALLAEKSVMARGLALIQAAVGRLRHTSLRVKELLETGQNVRVCRWGAAVAVLGVCAGSALLLQVPDLVGFRSPKPAANQLRLEAAVLRPRAGFSAPKLVAKADFATRLAPVTPQVVPAVFAKPVVLPARPFGVGSVAKARKQVAGLELARFSPATEASVHPVAASYQPAELVPVSVTTVVLVENDGGAEPGWRLWRVTLIYAAFYPGADQSVAPIPRRI